MPTKSMSPSGLTTSLSPARWIAASPPTLRPAARGAFSPSQCPGISGSNKLTWTLTANGETISIPASLDPLWVVEPLKDVGTNNTPPPSGLRF